MRWTRPREADQQAREGLLVHARWARSERRDGSEAVHRIGNKELALEDEIVESLGAFEHLYDAADVEGVDMKHYLANGYVVDVVPGKPLPDDQHDDLRVCRSPPNQLHEHLQTYLETAETLAEWS